MKYDLKVLSMGERLTKEKVNSLAEQVKESVFGIKDYSVGFSVGMPDANSNKVGKKTFALISFSGRFDSSRILTEICRSGYSIIESKFMEN